MSLTKYDISNSLPSTHRPLQSEDIKMSEGSLGTKVHFVTAVTTTLECADQPRIVSLPLDVPGN